MKICPCGGSRISRWRVGADPLGRRPPMRVFSPETHAKTKELPMCPNHDSDVTSSAFSYFHRVFTYLFFFDFCSRFVDKITGLSNTFYPQISSNMCPFSPSSQSQSYGTRYVWPATYILLCLSLLQIEDSQSGVKDIYLDPITFLTLANQYTKFDMDW